MSAFHPSDDEPHADAADARLLEDFVRRRDNSAFTALVSRHSGWVHGVARRALPDAETARDVTQQVFILLVRKAARIKPDALGPWLHRTAVLECRNALRRERTRQRALPALVQHMENMNTPASENAAWQSALPVLDDAVNALPERERTLIVQRFLEKRSWREIGVSLGRSEDAVRMALPPALEKLSSMLKRRGAVVPAAALGAVFALAAKTVVPASAALAQRALAEAGPAVSAFRAGLLTWWPAAACLATGLAAGWQFTSPSATASSTASPGGSARGGKSSAGAGDRTTAHHGGFDLDAVLSELRTLEAVGNDFDLIVRLRVALADMPPSAAEPVLAVLRTRRWGADSIPVAEVFFRRWAEFDPEAAWKVIRAPDLLGASTRTVSAFFSTMSRDNPERFVRMLNSLYHGPPAGIYQLGAQEPIDQLREHLGNLPATEALPHLAAIRSPRMRSFGISAIKKNTAEDCAVLAPLAAALPTDVVTISALWQVTERWTKLDTEGAALWISTLPAESPQWLAAAVGYAKTVSETDPAAACRMLTGMPWTHYWHMREISSRWVKADKDEALRWLDEQPSATAEIRRSILQDAGLLPLSDDR